jgi:hypothetical protein
MKKINNKHSQNKAKRANKKIKRLKNKPRLSKQQRREEAIRQSLVSNFLRSPDVSQE